MSLVVIYGDVPGAGSPTSLLTTELNSLASGSEVVSTAGGSSGTFTNVYNSGIGGYPLGYYQLQLASVGSSLTAGSAVYVWFLLRLDGTNFDDGSTSVVPARSPDLILAVRAVSGAQVLSSGSTPLPCPVGTFKVLLQQNTGQTWASSGNSLIFQPFTNQIG